MSTLEETGSQPNRRKRLATAEATAPEIAAAAAASAAAAAAGTAASKRMRSVRQQPQLQHIEAELNILGDLLGEAPEGLPSASEVESWDQQEEQLQQLQLHLHQLQQQQERLQQEREQQLQLQHQPASPLEETEAGTAAAVASAADFEGPEPSALAAAAALVLQQQQQRLPSLQEEDLLSLSDGRRKSIGSEGTAAAAAVAAAGAATMEPSSGACTPGELALAGLNRSDFECDVPGVRFDHRDKAWLATWHDGKIGRP